MVSHEHRDSLETVDPHGLLFGQDDHDHAPRVLLRVPAAGPGRGFISGLPRGTAPNNGGVGVSVAAGGYCIVLAFAHRRGGGLDWLVRHQALRHEPARPERLVRIRHGHGAGRGALR